jgi:hypothetical protein
LNHRRWAPERGLGEDPRQVNLQIGKERRTKWPTWPDGALLVLARRLEDILGDLMGTRIGDPRRSTSGTIIGQYLQRFPSSSADFVLDTLPRILPPRSGRRDDDRFHRADRSGSREPGEAGESGGGGWLDVDAFEPGQEPALVENFGIVDADG